MDQKKRIWVASAGHGIFCYSDSTWKHYTKKDGIPCDSVTDIYMDKKGRVWVATYRGLVYWDEKGWHRQSFNEEEEIHIKFINSDRDGKIYVITDSFRIWYYNNKKWRQYLDLKNGRFTCGAFLIDKKDNTIWVCSSGIFKIKENVVEKFLPELQINTAQLDGDGNLWLGAGDKGLLKYNLTTKDVEAYVPYGGLPSNFVLGICAGNKDEIYVATNKGIVCFNGKEWLDYGFKEEIVAIQKDHNGNIWFLSGSGLKCIQDKDIINIPIPAKFYISSNINMQIDQHDRIWICGRDLNLVYDIPGANFSKITEQFDFPLTNIQTIYVNDKNNILIGTDNGLIMVKNGK